MKFSLFRRIGNLWLKTVYVESKNKTFVGIRFYITTYHYINQFVDLIIDKYLFLMINFLLFFIAASFIHNSLL